MAQRTNRAVFAIATVVLVIAGAGCEQTTTGNDIGTSTSGLSASNCVAKLALAAGNGQIGQVQLALDSVLRVRSTLEPGPGQGQCTVRPNSTALVTWVITSGNGSVTQTTTVTDTAGETSNRWVMGATLGAQTVEARILNSVNTAIATIGFTATAYSAPYRALRLTAGNNQTAVPSALLPVRPEVVLVAVKEAGGAFARIEQPIAAGQIMFTVISGGGTTNPSGASSTAANGTASVAWTLGSAPGPHRLRATAAGPATSDPRDTIQVDFVANATAFALRMVSGNAQRDTIGARLAPVAVEYVELLDAAGGTRAIAGAPVTWTVLTGGGSVLGTATTDNAGRSAALWTLGRAVGRQTIRASVPPVQNLPAAAFQVDFDADALLVIDSVVVTPSQTSITGIGTTRTLTATGYFNGQSVSGLTFDWTSLNNTVATVSSSGAVMTHAAGGPVGIVATERNSRKADTAFVTVLAPPPPRLAYARFDAASIAAGAANAAFAYNSMGGAITVQTLGLGHYEVVLPNLATPLTRATAVIVTPYGAGATWCKTESWRNGVNNSLIARVRCFDRAAAADGEFTLLVVGDAVLPHRFGFAFGDRPAVTTAYAPPDSAAYNSALQPISILRTGVGRYNTTFPGLARQAGAPAETVLLTAIGPDPYRCGLATDINPLLSATAQIACVHAAGAARTGIDAHFAVAVFDKGRAGMRWGSAYNGMLEEAPGTTVLSQTQSSAGGAVTQIRHGVGRYDIVFPGLGAPSGTEGVFIGSASENGDYCKLLGWQKNAQSQLIVQVQCYESDDSLFEDQDFTVFIIQ